MTRVLLLFIICCLVIISRAQAPVNDNCINATSINTTFSCQSTVGTVSLATQSISSITCGLGTSFTSKDVWFSFTASASTATIIASPSQQLPNNFNLVMSLYSACGGSLISSADQYGNPQPETIQATGLTAGSTYYISIYQYKNSVGSPDTANPTFSICVLGDAPTNVAKIDSDENLLISPYPTQSFINISKELVDNTHSILIYDMSGKTILYTDKVESTLNLETLPSGQYNIMFIQKTGGYNPKDRAINKILIKQ